MGVGVGMPLDAAEKRTIRIPSWRRMPARHIASMPAYQSAFAVRVNPA
jgi:hypothetical protein